MKIRLYTDVEGFMRSVEGFQFRALNKIKDGIRYSFFVPTEDLEVINDSVWFNSDGTIKYNIEPGNIEWIKTPDEEDQIAYYE